MQTVRLTKDAQKSILNDLLKRSPNNYGQYESAVAEIIKNVREKGDEAVFAYTRQFDKWEVDTDTVRVTKAEIDAAFNRTEPEFVEVLRRAAANIEDFHRRQLRNSWIETKPSG